MHVKVEIDITINLMQESIRENGTLLPLPANPNKVNRNLISTGSMQPSQPRENVPYRFYRENIVQVKTRGFTITYLYVFSHPPNNI